MEAEAVFCIRWSRTNEICRQGEPLSFWWRMEYAIMTYVWKGIPEEMLKEQKRKFNILFYTFYNL